MKKRMIIAGCRDYTNYDEAKKFIADSIIKFQMGETWILMSGKCKGTASLIEYARERQKPLNIKIINR